MNDKENKRIRVIIDMLSTIDKTKAYSDIINIAMGKYKMPTNFKEALKHVKRNRKYGNNDN
jgi:hypothetical protein